MASGWLSKHCLAKPSKLTSCSSLQKISEVRQSTVQQQSGSSKRCMTWGHAMKPNEQLASCASSPKPTRNAHWVSYRLRELLHPGWPQLDLTGDTLQYLGPLPKDCPCAISHKPMVGLSEGNKFWSSASPTLGEQFWLTYCTAFFKKPFALREGADVQKVSNSEVVRHLTLWGNAVQGYVRLVTVLGLSQANSTHLSLRHRMTPWIHCRVPVPCRLRGSWGSVQGQGHLVL